MNVTLLCIGLLGFLLLALGFGVSSTRGSSETLIGHSSDPNDSLHRWVRAHGNAAEYIPILAILMWLAGNGEPAGWVTIVIVIVTVCRFSHAIGMIARGPLDEANPFRFVGALGTYLGGAILAGVVVFAAL